MGAPPYQQLPVDHKNFTKQCPVADGTRRCRNMRSCDSQRYREAHPEGGKEVEYLIHNLTGRAGEIKAETRKQMTRRLHELSDCMKHHDPKCMEDSVRKTLEQLERAERFIAMQNGVAATQETKSHPVEDITRPDTPMVGFVTVGGLPTPHPTPPQSTRTSLESTETTTRPSTADQARSFWGVSSQSKKVKLEQESPQTPPKNSRHHPSPPAATPAAPRRRTTNTFPSIHTQSLPDKFPSVPTTTPATSYLTRIHHLEAENQRLRDELVQANRRAETERDIAKAARRAANQWRAHYERYKGEVRAFFKESQKVEDREPQEDAGGLEMVEEEEEDDGYGSEE